jgi:hypothetical protein
MSVAREKRCLRTAKFKMALCGWTRATEEGEKGHHGDNEEKADARDMVEERRVGGGGHAVFEAIFELLDKDGAPGESEVGGLLAWCASRRWDGIAKCARSGYGSTEGCGCVVEGLDGLQGSTCTIRKAFIVKPIPSPAEAMATPVTIGTRQA